MLDLTAKLAAAGLVTKEQVEKVEKDKEEKRERASKPRPTADKGRQGKGRQGGGRQGKGRQGGGKPGKQGRQRQAPGKKPLVDVESLKSLNRGDAYDRIRKTVAQHRLDDPQTAIPKENEQAFNFVTMKGRIGRLYVTETIAASLRDGSAGISAFMSHHGLAHCVLPKEIALALAQVFPLWLRHLGDHPDAGQLEAPPSST